MSTSPLKGVQKPDEEVNGKNYDVRKGRGLVLVQMVRPVEHRDYFFCRASASASQPRRNLSGGTLDK
jgi:hypothetical protein